MRGTFPPMILETWFGITLTCSCTPSAPLFVCAWVMEVEMSAAGLTGHIQHGQGWTTRLCLFHIFPYLRVAYGLPVAQSADMLSNVDLLGWRRAPSGLEEVQWGHCSHGPDSRQLGFTQRQQAQKKLKYYHQTIAYWEMTWDWLNVNMMGNMQLVTNPNDSNSLLWPEKLPAN